MDKNWNNGGVFLVLFIVVGLDYNKTPLFKALFILIEIVMHCVGAIFAFFFLQLIARKVHYDKILIQFGSKYSMFIYLFHQQIIQLVLVAVYEWSIPILISMVCFFIAIITSSLLAMVVSNVKILRFMFSGES